MVISFLADLPMMGKPASPAHPGDYITNKVYIIHYKENRLRLGSGGITAG
jgi:hypothetical protein